MEMTIPLIEAVKTTKRPWWDWADGEWITVSGLGASGQSAAYTRFQRAMHSWASRNEFSASMVKIGDDGRFRLRWRRPTAAGVYLLWSTASLRWLGEGGAAMVPGEQYYRAGVFDMLAARELCQKAVGGPWTQYRRVLPGDDGSSMTMTGQLPPVIPLPAVDLPELVTARAIAAARERAEKWVMWALEEGDTSSDPVISTIVAESQVRVAFR